MQHNTINIQDETVAILSGDPSPVSLQNDETEAAPFNLYTQIVLGIGRDLPWAVATIKNWSWPFGNSLGNTWGPWLNQSGIGSVGLLATSAVGMFALPKYRSKLGMAVMSMYAAASLLAIVPWNYGQALGTKMGQDEFGMSPDNAGYFSSIFTGVFEMVIQYAVISGISAALDQNERKKWKFDINHCLQRGVEMLLGIPGGAMWQLVYQATYNWAKENTVNLISSGTGVAFSVAGTTLLTSKLAERITDAIDHYLGEEQKNSYRPLPT